MLPHSRWQLHIVPLSHGEAYGRPRKTSPLRSKPVSRTRILLPRRRHHPKTQSYNPLQIPVSPPPSISALYLLAPKNASQRSHSQGCRDFRSDGAIFLTITHAHSAAPTAADLQSLLAEEIMRDRASANPLGRAMARITNYPGNTVLQSGKNRKRDEGFVYIVKRTSRIP
jgi:hypothetical protein